MLKVLIIENLAIIKKMEIEFCPGLNIFTGETGAGKSIMLKALSLIVGARCSKDIIRFGEKTATVEAVFENLPKSVIDIINSVLKVQVKNGQISVKRIVYDDGKSKALVNNIIINIGDLKKIGQKLINFNEQGSSQTLLNSENDSFFLDSFAEINELVADYRIKFLEFNRVFRKLEQLELKIKQKTENFSELKSKISEIEKANIKPGEYEKISKNLKIIKNSTEIFEILKSINMMLNGNFEHDGVLNNINSSTKQLEKISGFNDEFRLIFEKFKSLNFELEEAAFEIEKLKNKLDFEPGKLEFLENRLSEIVKIKRKFGPEIEDVENKLASMKLELEQIENYDVQKQKLVNLKNEKLVHLKKQLIEISKKRKEFANIFSNAILNELNFLEMKNSKFAVELMGHKANLNGLEDAIFLISTNLGEPLKPLCKVASGGELSRILLAIVSVMSNKFKPSTLVFDEIDSGVSGIAAEKIKIKLKQLSKNTQIVCITHLAQIASAADKHFKIFKTVDHEKRINSKILNLNFDEKIKEIARLIGGCESNELILNLATELIKQNQN